MQASWLSEEQIAAVITRVTQPPAGQGRWSVRSMAKEVGISAGSVYKLWKSNDLKPHLVRTFKLSPSRLWNKIIKGKSDFFLPQKPNRSSTSTIPLKLQNPDY